MKKRRFFQHKQLGYKQNPFGALSQDDWQQTAFLPAEVLSCFSESKAHIQLLGAEGSGKSSTLHRMIELLVARGLSVAYEYIPEGQTFFNTELAELDVFVLDEAQRLNWWWRRKWLGWVGADRSRRTLFGSHENLMPFFERKGLSVCSFAVDGLVSVLHYEQWIERRLAFFALADGERARFSPDAVVSLYELFGADMRAAEYFLYEVFQDLETAVLITPELLNQAWQNCQATSHAPP